MTQSSFKPSSSVKVAVQQSEVFCGSDPISIHGAIKMPLKKISSVPFPYVLRLWNSAELSEIILKWLCWSWTWIPTGGRPFFYVKFACLWVLWLPQPSKTCTPGQFSSQCPDQGTCLESRISLQALHIGRPLLPRDGLYTEKQFYYIAHSMIVCD